MAAQDGSSDSTDVSGKERVAPLSEPRLSSGLRVEEIGDEVLVLDPDGDVVHRVTGAGVDVLRHVHDCAPPPAPSVDVAAAVDALVQAGIIDIDPDVGIEDTEGPSRRRVLAAGGTALAAATVTTFALADPAAAATGCTNGKTPTPYGKFTTPGTYTFVTGQVSSILVRLWDGGGGGGNGIGSGAGGGGGGGGWYLMKEELDVTPCAEYTLIVGAGGAAEQAGEWSDFGDSSGVNWDVENWGGDGGNGSASSPWGGGGGGGSGGHGGPGGNGAAGGSSDALGGAAGAGTPGGASGGTGSASGSGGAGSSPGGGGGGGSGSGSGFPGGSGGSGAVWVGV